MNKHDRELLNKLIILYQKCCVRKNTMPEWIEKSRDVAVDIVELMCRNGLCGNDFESPELDC